MTVKQTILVYAAGRNFQYRSWEHLTLVLCLIFHVYHHVVLLIFNTDEFSEFDLSTSIFQEAQLRVGSLGEEMSTTRRQISVGSQSSSMYELSWYYDTLNLYFSSFARLTRDYVYLATAGVWTPFCRKCLPPKLLVVLVFYDYLLTLPLEFSEIWHGRFTLAKFFYLLNRYASLLLEVAQLMYVFPGSTDMVRHYTSMRKQSSDNRWSKYLWEHLSYIIDDML